MGSLWRTENDCYVDRDVKRVYEVLLPFRLWDSRFRAERYMKRDGEPRGR